MEAELFRTDVEIHTSARDEANSSFSQFRNAPKKTVCSRPGNFTHPPTIQTTGDHDRMDENTVCYDRQNPNTAYIAVRALSMI